MKNLILCSFLLLFVGFTYSQESVKLEDIGLEVMTKDLGQMNWEEAKKACADLGDGWRLPTIDELKSIVPYKDKFETLSRGYWSSTDYAPESDDYCRKLGNCAYNFIFSGKLDLPGSGDFRNVSTSGTTFSVRAVRNIK